MSFNLDDLNDALYNSELARMFEATDEMSDHSDPSIYRPSEVDAKGAAIKEPVDLGFFDLPGLPDEMISHIFSFLDVETFLKARLNKRLNDIVLKSKCYVNELVIKELERPPEESMSGGGKYRCPRFQYIKFFKNRSYSVDCIRRLTQNLSIGSLHYYIDRLTDFNREVCSLLKDFDLEKLRLSNNDWFNYIAGYKQDGTLMDVVMDDSYLLDLSRMCKSLNAGGSAPFEKITSEGLHKLYKMMIGKSVKMRKMEITIMEDQCISFLKLIGITVRGGNFFSNRHIEAIKFKQDDDDDRVFCMPYLIVRLFDGNFEISFDMAPMFGEGSGDISFEMHESEESLHNAKNSDRYEKFIVAPE